MENNKPHRLLNVLCGVALVIALLALAVALTPPKPTLMDIYNESNPNNPFLKSKEPFRAHFIDPIYDRIDALQTRVDTLENLVSSYRWDRANKGYVNLTGQGWQRLDETFFFSEASVTQHLTGVKVSGRIVNSASVIYENLTFRIAMKNSNNTFWISRVSPGNSTAFTVYLDMITVENAKAAWITYETSTIRYAR